MIIPRILSFMLFLILWMQYAMAQSIQNISTGRTIAFSSDMIGQISGLTFSDTLIYATEGRSGQVHVFDDKLKHQFSFGQTGRGPGDLSWPSHIIEVNGKIYVEEGRELRLSIFDMNGNYINNILLKKRAFRFSLFNNSLFGFDRSSQNPFYIFNLEDESIFEFGHRFNPNNSSNRYELAARNQYSFQLIEPHKIIIVNESSGDFYNIHFLEKPEINKINAEISEPYFQNRLHYVENYFNSTKLQQLSWPLLITDLQICNDAESVYIAYTGQDVDRIQQGMLLSLSYKNDELIQTNSFSFEDRLFRNFALTNDCRFIFFYDQMEGKLVKYALED
jgi:hypothetical protein